MINCDSNNLVALVNDGEIDERLVTVMGVNVKDSASPIGYFGTGLKFALAMLLRTGHEVEIWSGEKKLSFELRADVIRGKEFNFVVMNGQVLSFTTDLGKNWEPWMAFRELYSNMLDENGSAIASFVEPRKGVTTILVRGSAFADCFRRRNEYFISGEPLWARTSFEVFAKQASGGLFYRGVKVADSVEGKGTKYSYNILSGQTLTEDRTLRSTWLFAQSVGRELLACKDEKLLETVLRAERGTWEHEFDFCHRYSETSEEFLTVAEKYLRKINASAQMMYFHCRPREEFEEVPLTAKNKWQLARAEKFLEVLGYVPGEYELQVVRDLGENVLGMAKGKKILLTLRVFEMGTKQLASTLLEEFIHVSRGYSDESREMQTFLFDKIIGLVEDLKGETL